MSDITVPERPSGLGLVVRNDSWLPGQKEAIEEVLSAFLVGGKKFVMLSAPTGAGKSLIAAAVQKLLARAGGSGEGRSVALTHTIQLQQQYAQTLPEVAVVTGRANHPCDLPDDSPARLGFPDLNAEDAPCSSPGVGCPIGLNRIGGCSYYSQFWEAAESPMVAMNYAYAARILQQDWFRSGQDEEGNPISIRNPFRRTLLIADESHLAENAIIGAAGVNINGFTLRDIGIGVPSLNTRQRVMEGRTEKWYETTGVWVAWAAENIETAEMALGRAQVEEQTNPSPENRRKTKRLAALVDALAALAAITPEDFAQWTVRRNNGVSGNLSALTSITVQPLWGWAAADRLLWRHFDKVLLMSATPGDPTIETVKLGIPAEETTFIERPSYFPVENRPIYYWPIVKLNYRSDDIDWEKMGKAILQIANSYPDRKGLVHAGSHANARRLVSILGRLNGANPRFFTQSDGRGSAQAALNTFIQSPSPLVFVTASFTTGLDLPYIIGWQVIAKVPYGSLGDEIVAQRRAFKTTDGVDFGQKVYQSEAMNTVIQAAGRIVRTADDSGPTFILDGNYELLHRLAWMPEFYRQAYKKLEWSK